MNRVLLAAAAVLAAAGMPSAAADGCRPAGPTASGTLLTAPPTCATVPTAAAKPRSDVDRSTLPDGRTGYTFGNTTVLVGGSVQVDMVGGRNSR